MKKICFVLFLVMLVAPVVSFAAISKTAEEIKASNGQTISTLSNKVTLAASAGGNAYAALTGHESGSKIYGSTSGVTKIYQKVSDPVDVAADAPTDSDTAQFSTWTAM